MNIIFKPAGGRYGRSFDYYCKDCGTYIGNSYKDEILKHPSKTRKFFKTKIVTCQYAGKTLFSNHVEKLEKEK